MTENFGISDSRSPQSASRTNVLSIGAAYPGGVSVGGGGGGLGGVRGVQQQQQQSIPLRAPTGRTITSSASSTGPPNPLAHALGLPTSSFTQLQQQQRKLQFYNTNNNLQPPQSPKQHQTSLASPLPPPPPQQQQQSQHQIHYL